MNGVEIVLVFAHQGTFAEIICFHIGCIVCVGATCGTFCVV